MRRGRAKLTSRAPNRSYVFQQKLSFLSSGKALCFLTLPLLFRDPLYILPVLSVYLSRFPTRRLDGSLRKFQVSQRTAHRSFCRRESFVIHTTGWATLLLISVVIPKGSVSSFLKVTGIFAKFGERRHFSK